MRPVDYTYRRHAAANALLKTVLRKRRAAVQDLDDQVRATLRFQEQPVTQLSGYEEIIKTWCDDLDLGCEAIRSEALDVVLTRGRNLEERTGEDDSAPFYNLPVIPGESLNKFVLRAKREFYRMNGGASPVTEVRRNAMG
jgi:hypothetical protein